MTNYRKKYPYLQFIASQIKRYPQPKNNASLVIDLFAGCGGLALGFEAAGFKTIGYEMLPDACATYRHNLSGACKQVKLTEETELTDKPEVIIGGPPCQPFSVSGRQKGLKDSRDGFPIFLNAVKRYAPKLAIFENVRGMLFRNKTYFEEIVSSLRNMGYIVEWEIMTASDYGVPQKRQRLFCVAHQGGWHWPKKTHLDAPLTVGDALGEWALMPRDDEGKFLTASMDEYVKKYELKSKCVRPRDLHLNEPARTVTCRNLGAATGDMLRLRLPDGRRRRLTVREGARLQSFPDWFEFRGSEQSQFNQIGNAVPPILGKAIADCVKVCLDGGDRFLSQKTDLLNQPIQLSLKLF
ncbi:MAG: DNA cytosine methyltransferase [Cyanobacteriota bacterium]|nr:DNA cytosine methyltransferase [Cyanobacteriota bacterium]